MSMKNASQSTSAEIVSKTRSFIVYDRVTGAVLHVHHAVEFANGMAGLETHESRARRFAAAKPAEVSDILEVSTDHFDQAKPMRVDPISLAIHWEPHGRRTRKGRQASRDRP
jgi:hypothetical protein